MHCLALEKKGEREGEVVLACHVVEDGPHWIYDDVEALAHSAPPLAGTWCNRGDPARSLVKEAPREGTGVLE